MTRLDRRIHEWERSGNGRGPEYRPWIDVRSGSTSGEANRVWSRASGRVCHLLSREELVAFLIFDLDEKTIDIREQFPLLPLAETIELSREMKVRHSRGPSREMTYRVLTTDLVVTRAESDGARDFAYAVKTAKRRHHRITMERLALEEAYWHSRGVPWDLFVLDEQHPTLLANIEWLEGVRFCPWESFDPPVDPAQERRVFELLLGATDALTAAARRADVELGLRPGTSLTIARVALARGVWSADLSAGHYPFDRLVGLRRSRPYGAAVRNERTAS